jgi:hypothetical protein
MPLKKYFYTFIILNDYNMKKSIFLLLTLCLIGSCPVNSQSLLKKVAGSMKDELLGTKKTKTDPEPACACSDAEMVVGLGGKLQIDYKEADISTLDDGSILIKDKVSGNFYIVKDGIISGPLSQGDPRIAVIEESSSESKDPSPSLMKKYRQYISMSGDKYVITFKGQKYGPYARIFSFSITQSGDKFGALAVETIVVTEDEGKKMDAAIKNAKTDQEKMDLAMQYSQQMSQKMIQGGGAEGISQRIVTNIPGAKTDIVATLAGMMNAKAKYDDIVMIAYGKISDLTGKQLISIKPEYSGVQDIYLNTANTKYAVFSYGTLTLSDGTSYTDIFNPHLVKTAGQVYLAYDYFSPKKNAIMMCKISW